MQKPTHHTRLTYGHDRRVIAARAQDWDTKLAQDAMFEELVSLKDEGDTLDTLDALDLYSARDDEIEAERQAVLDAEPPPDVDAAYTEMQDNLARAADAHALLPVLRAADAPLAEGVPARHTEQARRRIGEIRARAHSLTALVRAQLHAVSSTIAAQVLPAPRRAATSAA